MNKVIEVECKKRGPGRIELKSARNMIAISMAICSCVAGMTAQAQPTDTDFKFFRWDEDYRYLSEAEAPSFYQRLKYSELFESGHFSLGGGIRERLNHYQNDLFGLRPNNDGELLLTRLLVHGDLHVNETIRTFVELGYHDTWENGLTSGPFDEDELDVTQAFVDISSDTTRWRIGRQEMSLGSTRLVGVRDGPNVRRSFDGVRVDSNWGKTNLRLFGLQEVRVDRGSWDNEANDREELWGVYASLPTKLSRFDIYYLGLNRDDGFYAQGTDQENRHSFGVRAFGQSGPWDWDFEAVYQGGRFGEADIRAWTAATITGFTFDSLAWKPRLAMSVNMASGDDDPEDGDLKTFNPLFPNLMYFEEAAILTPQNFMNLEPEITLHPSDRLSISFDWDFFWKFEKEDAVYVRGLRPLAGTEALQGRFVTHVPSVSIDYRINRHLEVNLSYSHFFAGEVIDEAGGDDVRFLKLEAQLKF